MKRLITLTGILMLVLIATLFFLDSCGNYKGDIIVKVNTEPIFESDFNKELDYHLSFMDIDLQLEKSDKNPSRMTEDELKKHILSDMLIPMAAVKSKYKDKLDQIMTKANSIKDELEKNGNNFKKAVKIFGDDKGIINSSTIFTYTRSSQKYPIPRTIFTAEKGALVGPFFSLIGCHIFYISDKVKGVIPSADAVRAAQILLPFEPDKPDYIATILPNITEGAKIEVLNSDFAPYVKR